MPMKNNYGAGVGKHWSSPSTLCRITYSVAEPLIPLNFIGSV